MGGWEGGHFQLKEPAKQVTQIALGVRPVFLFKKNNNNLGFEHTAGTNKMTVDVPALECAPHILLT